MFNCFLVYLKGRTGKKKSSDPRTQIFLSEAGLPVPDDNEKTGWAIAFNR